MVFFIYRYVRSTVISPISVRASPSVAAVSFQKLSLQQRFLLCTVNRKSKDSLDPFLPKARLLLRPVLIPPPPKVAQSPLFRRRNAHQSFRELTGLRGRKGGGGGFFGRVGKGKEGAGFTARGDFYARNAVLKIFSVLEGK